MGAVGLTNGRHEGPIPVQSHLRKNDTPRGWVVQKFGGTSVGKLPANIAEDIVRWEFKLGRGKGAIY
jgi:aspartate kinase